tara:strand:+ start:1535 stop:2485 length:951 start_codon:yes stop_codon:yes gene_type:complete
MAEQSVFVRPMNREKGMANILVVDDDPRISKFLCEQLTHKGHSCRYETRGETALENVNKNPFDLLILDVMLPDVSGFEVCRRIRANTDLYTLPILFLSSMNSDEEIHHGLAQGADDYVTKPFNTGALLTRIENLLTASAGLPLKDDLTGLPTAKSIKLEIQKSINNKVKFVVGYIELIGVNDFSQQAGREEYTKALRHFGRCLHLSARDVSPRFFSVGHMGGGHFVFIISPDSSGAYSDRVEKIWQKHLHGFLESVGKPTQIKSWIANKMLEYLMCVTTCESDSNSSSRELFEILSHLRSKASTAGQSGLFQDRRS